MRNRCSYWSQIVVATVFSVIFGCARQAAPTGGQKDITPPKVVRSIPVYKSLMFKGKKVVITFDEFIALEKVTDKFTISPPLVKKPNIVVKGKSLNIDFSEKLKDSVTYTLYFQDAVRDLNEGNPIDDFQFVFSTGNNIDSLSVTGNVYNANNLEVPNNAVILLHKNLSDSAVAKLMPDYVTMPDKNGGFRINNIKPGKYRLYALQDKNNNKKFDLSDENFAFFDQVIEVSKEKNYLPVIVVKDTSKVKGVKKKAPETPLIDGQYKLFMFTAPKKNHYLTSSERKTANLLFYSLSLPPDTVTFSLYIPDARKGSYFLEKNITNDTVRVWLTDSVLYSKQKINTIVGFPFTDSTGVTRLKTDTIAMSFTPPRVTKATKTKETQNKFTFRTNIPGNGINANLPFLFLAETPFRAPDTSKIHLFRTDKKTETMMPYILKKDSLSPRRYIFTAKFRAGDSYLLVADSASFGNIYGAVSDSMGIRFSARTPESYSKLTLNITDVTGNILIQLLDTKENIILQKEINKDEKLIFTMLDPGKYRMRAVNDLNGDGKWTTGDFKFNRQPEPVTYLQAEVEIKANFDTEEDWSLKNWNQKNPKLRTVKEEGK